jgi:hypothetical protein
VGAANVLLPQDLGGDKLDIIQRRCRPPRREIDSNGIVGSQSAADQEGARSACVKVDAGGEAPDDAVLDIEGCAGTELNPARPGTSAVDVQPL